ncbi:HAD-IA family hydrolase [Glycomyces sp. TRM65418]|uniref:HAD-IA family hydrolase n=1 Tax=Glycomyces sp. TRM65418 TaxID=2867006 RepID=UPI001CE5E5D4|nr:HAD-IA family hydrolase [Glycomyces sp. TRM65418]MCC3763145.1 HAD-IA family hydrolase [Glycomyces sp. TRM65418]QZD57151.1 HAD-IA family hydrolase [Glycomyces sp. TRM65418]
MSDSVLTASILLFDMDGTLVDSTASVERAWSRFAARHGLDAARILAVAHGRPTIEVVAEFAPDGVDAVAETDRIEAEEIDRTDGISEIPGAAALLGGLDRDRWAVVTSATRALTTRRLAAVGIPLPKILVAADDVTKGKPHPQPYLLAAKALGFDARDAVVFEDAPAGLASARAAGAATVVVGGYEGEAAEGLPRVADLKSVQVSVDGDAMSVTLG